MMNILVINWQDRTHPQAGGAEVHLHEIFSRIASNGHTVTLLCCQHSGAPPHEVLDGLTVKRIGLRPLFNYVVPVWWMLVGRSNGYDIVVDDINKLPFFTPLFVNKPILALVHHFFGNSIFSEVGRIAGNYVHWFEKHIPRVYASTPICTVSESTRQECLDFGFPATNLHIIHNAIDPRLFPMQATTKAAVPTLVYFGRLKRYKSVHHIIEALIKVRELIPTVQLEILGTGTERENLELMVANLGLAEHVTFRGYISNDEKTKYLSTAHLAINSSIKEGWGITNIEANACGTPVISADVPGLRDSVNPGLSGILYEYGNVSQLAELIVRVLTNGDELHQLTVGAVTWASQFTWDQSAQKMQALCERVCNSRL